LLTEQDNTICLELTSRLPYVGARMAQTSKVPVTERAEDENSLAQGSLWKAIWVMSWPLLLTTTGSSLGGLVDVQVSKYLGSPSQAAVGISEQIVFLFLVFIMATGTGTTALASRAAGANDRDAVATITGQSISLSFLMGLGLATFCLLIAGPGVSRVSDSPEVVALAISYMNVFALLLIPFSITTIINCAFRSIGDAKTPLVIVAVITAVNISGDYLTVLHGWPVPGLGIRGIALASVVSSLVGSMIAIIALYRSPLKASFSKLLPLSADSCVRVLKVGLPSAVQRFGWALSVFVVFFILRHCQDPTAAIASWTIGMRIEALIFMPLMALSLSVASIVGQSLGAQKTDRAFKAGWQVTYIGIAMMVIMGMGLFFGADTLAHLMSQDPSTILYSRRYLQINSLTEPFLALSMVLTGALQGAGDTRTPMWITIFTNWIIRLPLAWLLCINLKMGPDGVWISMATSVVLSALLATWRYQSKAWLKTRV
jgi:putative MATE family efflux protein